MRSTLCMAIELGVVKTAMGARDTNEPHFGNRYDICVAERSHEILLTFY